MENNLSVGTVSQATSAQPKLSAFTVVLIVVVLIQMGVVGFLVREHIRMTAQLQLGVPQQPPTGADMSGQQDPGLADTARDTEIIAKHIGDTTYCVEYEQATYTFVQLGKLTSDGKTCLPISNTLIAALTSYIPAHLLDFWIDTENGTAFYIADGAQGNEFYAPNVMVVTHYSNNELKYESFQLPFGGLYSGGKILTGSGNNLVLSVGTADGCVSRATISVFDVTTRQNVRDVYSYETDCTVDQSTEYELINGDLLWFHTYNNNPAVPASEIFQEVYTINAYTGEKIVRIPKFSQAFPDYSPPPITVPVHIQKQLSPTEFPIMSKEEARKQPPGVWSAVDVTTNTVRTLE